MGIFLKCEQSFVELRPKQRWVALSFPFSRVIDHARIARTMRSGVQGSSRPGLSAIGVPSTTDGIQSECTPGELLGRTAASTSVVGVYHTGTPSCRPLYHREAPT